MTKDLAIGTSQSCIGRLDAYRYQLTIHHRPDCATNLLALLL